MKLLPNPRPQPPVFCKDCKWYTFEISEWGGWEDCNAPVNLKDSYAQPKVIRVMKPRQRNRRNKCSAFEPKPPSFFVRLLVRLTR